MPYKKYNWRDAKPKLINNQIRLDDVYVATKSFKKITGSRFASILGLNKYTSPFKTWLMMVGLYEEKMDDTLANAGNVIEPLLRDYVSEVLNIEYKSYVPNDVGYDIFKNDKIFGGIPDGEPLVAGAVDYSLHYPMLEIKTTSKDKIKYSFDSGSMKMVMDEETGLPIVSIKNDKYNTWHPEGNLTIPKEYVYQLALYLYLRNISKGVFCVGFLEPDDYIYPQKFNIKKRHIELKTMEVDLDNFILVINKARKWYQDYIEGGVSPYMSDDDLKLYTELNEQYEKDL